MTAAVRALRPATPRPPVNPLCNSDEPIDVLAAMRPVVEMLRVTQRAATSTDQEAEMARQGTDWTLGMVTDAIEYAQALVEAQRGAS